MHWNHRVVLVKNREGEDEYRLAEVYWGPPGEAGLTEIPGEDHWLIGWTDEPFLAGSSVDELQTTVDRLLLAVARPVIDVRHLPSGDERDLP